LRTSASAATRLTKAGVCARRPRIVSDVQFSSQLAHLAECRELETGPRSLADRLRFWCRAAVEWTRSDVIFLERDLSPLLGWCVIAALLRWRWRCKLACVDLLLPRPVTRRDKVLAAIKSLLLRHVDLIILFQKDFAAYERYYHLRPSQLRYVPFKTNFLDIVQMEVVADDGYCWSGGTTYRDWTTLAKAVEGLEIRVVITIPDDDELKRRGEADDTARLRRGVPGIVPDKRMFVPMSRSYATARTHDRGSAGPPVRAAP